MDFESNEILLPDLCVFVQLSEWWMQSTYLDCRMPVPVYTSPGVILPRMHFQDRQGQMR